MKNSFTLIEMLISIAIFSMIMTFLYSMLDSQQRSLKSTNKELKNIYKSNNFNRIIFKDIIESNCKFKLNKKQNMITILNTTNTLHNPFYTQIRYVLTKNNNIIRIESKPLNISNQQKLNDILEESYIDLMLKNIEKFETVVYNVSGGVAFYIKDKKNQLNLFKVRC
jgi:prepilin-type N-terminal cleavage/methylation domain-containing protein